MFFENLKALDQNKEAISKINIKLNVFRESVLLIVTGTLVQICNTLNARSRNIVK